MWTSLFHQHVWVDPRTQPKISNANLGHAERRINSSSNQLLNPGSHLHWAKRFGHEFICAPAQPILSFRPVHGNHDNAAVAVNGVIHGRRQFAISRWRPMKIWAMSLAGPDSTILKASRSP